MRTLPRATLALLALAVAPAPLRAQDAAFPLRVGPTGRYPRGPAGRALPDPRRHAAVAHPQPHVRGSRPLHDRAQGPGLQRPDGLDARRLRLRRQQGLLARPLRPAALRGRRPDAAERAVLGACRSRVQGGREARVPAARDAGVPRRRQGRLRRPPEEGRASPVPRVWPLDREAVPCALEPPLGARRRPQPLGRARRGAGARAGDPRGGRAALAHRPLGERDGRLRLLRRRGLARRQQLVHLRARGLADPRRPRGDRPPRRPSSSSRTTRTTSGARPPTTCAPTRIAPSSRVPPATSSG